jgi:hypothetical protein
MKQMPVGRTIEQIKSESLARQAPLGWKTALRVREAEIMADQVHQVGGVLAIMDGEVWIKCDLLSMFAQQARTYAVKGAGPGQSVGYSIRAYSDCPPGDPLTRRVISAAARRENVISRILRGSAPLTIRCASRLARGHSEMWATVQVLPENEFKPGPDGRVSCAQR